MDLFADLQTLMTTHNSTGAPEIEVREVSNWVTYGRKLRSRLFLGLVLEFEASAELQV